MTDKMKLTIILLTLLGVSAVAQTPKGRIESARAELKKLERQAENLPQAPKLDRTWIATPKPALSELAATIYRFAKTNSDLDLAPRASILEAEVRIANGDPASAIAATKRAVGHSRAGEFHKIRSLSLSAASRFKYGDFKGARADLETLLKDYPNNNSAQNWRALLERCKTDEAEQTKDLNRLGLLRKNKVIRPSGRSLGRALRFAATFPLAQASRVILEGAMMSLANASAQQKMTPCERLSHYWPESNMWADATAFVVGEFAREGEYEKAHFHTLKLLNHSEVLKGRQANQLQKLEVSLKARLRAINLRPLEVEPKTKRVRLAHFLKFAKPYADQDMVASLAEGLRADYPTMSELPHVTWILARALATEFPEKSLTLFREIAEKNADSRWGYDALLEAKNKIIATEGPEATETWLASIAGNFKRSDHQINIALLRADLLDKLDRWEDAKALLLPLQEKAFGSLKDEITERIAAYDKKIGD